MTWNFFDLLNDLGLDVMNISLAPNAPGFYLLFAENGDFIYVGKAGNLKSRIQEHFSNNEKNVRIKDIAKYVIWKTTVSLNQAEEAEGKLFDIWVQNTGLHPFANINKPPRSRLNDEASSKEMLYSLLKSFIYTKI